MGVSVAPQAFFSLLRWRADPKRDEARNVAVILVDEAGRMGGVRAAPISGISNRLHDQGLLDSVLQALQERFTLSSKPALADLEEMRRDLKRSIYLTEPRPVAVLDVETTLDALYRAYAMPASAGPTKGTKGYVLDRVMASLRKMGWLVRRGEYVGDFIFDLVVESPNPLLGEVLSFASGAANLIPVEQAAGHFLYGLGHVSRSGLAIIEPPPDASSESAKASYVRVRRWMESDGVRVIQPADLQTGQTRLAI